MSWGWFLVALWTGAFLGFFLAAILSTGARADELMSARRCCCNPKRGEGGA